jgi:hypothetical protein
MVVPGLIIQSAMGCYRWDSLAADQNDSKIMDFYTKSKWIHLIAPPCLGEALRRGMITIRLCMIFMVLE